MHISTQQTPLFDLKELLMVVLYRKRAILWTTLLFIVLGVLFCLFRPNLYQADLIMQISGDDNTNNVSNVIGMNNPANSLLNPNTVLQSEKTLINSRSVLGPVIETQHLDLNITPRYFPLIGEGIAQWYDNGQANQRPASSWSWFRHYSWGGDHIDVHTITVTAELYLQTFTIEYLGQNHYQLSGPDGKVLLKNANTGQNYHIDLANQQNININISGFHARPGVQFQFYKYPIQKILKVLKKQLTISADTNTNLLSLSMTGYHPRKVATLLNAIAKSATTSYVNRIANSAGKALFFLRSRLPIVREDLSRAESALRQYQTQSGSVLLTNQAKLLTEKMSELDVQTADLQTQLAKLRTQYTDDSFQVKQVLTALKSVSREREQLQGNLKNIPDADQKLISLQREVDVQNQIYTTLLNQIQHYDLIRASDIGNLSVVEHAIEPYLTANMPAIQTIFLFALVGLFLSFITTLTWQYFKDGLLHPKTAGSICNAPLLCILFQHKLFRQLTNKHQQKIQFFSEVDPRHNNNDNLRMLRTQLLIHAEKHNQPLVITNSAPHEGCGTSMLSANLAQLMADAGKSVVLVDGDLRNGLLHQYFDNSKEHPGLSNLLKGNATLEEVLQNTRFEHLHFIARGHLPLKRSELCLQPNVAEIIAALGKQFDVVIIDLPPILTAPETLLILQHTCYNLLTFCAMRTTHKGVQQAVHRLRQAEIDIHGYVFNQAYPANNLLQV